MGNRLSKIYTRTGDDGTTGLGDGSRIGKDSLLIECIGSADELNSFIGVLLACELPDSIRHPLTIVQHNLFDIGGELCMPGYTVINAEDVTALEQTLDALNANLPPLKNFILPGGNTAAAFCHLARTECRRTERKLVKLAQQHEFNPFVRHYINRLSDLLFVCARLLNRQDGADAEVLWQPKPDRK